jgi:hypothetical protein
VAGVAAGAGVEGVGCGVAAGGCGAGTDGVAAPVPVGTTGGGLLVAADSGGAGGGGDTADIELDIVLDTGVAGGDEVAGTCGWASAGSPSG